MPSISLSLSPSVFTVTVPLMSRVRDSRLQFSVASKANLPG